MSFEWFIGLRYLKSRRGKSLISIVTLISIAGVALGVMALIIVISVMNGFDKDLMQRITGSLAHIEVYSRFYGGMYDYKMLTEKIKKIDGVIGASPLIDRQAMLSKYAGVESKKIGAALRGIDPQIEKDVTDLAKNNYLGKTFPSDNEIILGTVLAERLEVTVGQSIYAVTRLVRTPNGPRAMIRKLNVVGLFKSGLYEIDANFAYINLTTGQKVYAINEDLVDSIQVKLKDPFSAERISDEIREKLGQVFEVLTWQERHQSFFFALKLEKFAMFVILLLIVIVAAFNIISTLIMVVIEKTREIGILKSMGAKNKSILQIFLIEGLVIGLVGTILGLAGGLISCYLLQKYKLISLPEAVYNLSTMPVDVQPFYVFLIAFCSIAICLVAGVLPAYRAAKLDPVEALRYE